jgi:hypothetical protein
MSEPPRRFPPPWEIEDNGACFIIHDANGRALAEGGGKRQYRAFGDVIIDAAVATEVNRCGVAVGLATPFPK